MNRRVQNMAIAVAGCVALLVGGLSDEWWSGDAVGGMARMNLGLREATACIAGLCETAPLSEVVGRGHSLFKLATLTAWIVSLVAAIGILVGLVLRQVLGWLLPLRAIGYFGLVALALAVLVAATFPGMSDSGLKLSWAFWTTLAGGLVAFAGAFSASLDDSFEGREYKPIGPIVAPVPTPLPPQAAGPGAGPTDPTDANRHRMEYSRVVAVAAKEAIPANAAEARRDRWKSAPTRPAAADAAARALRFVVKELTIGDAGLQAVGPEGDTRTLGWTDMAALFVAQLPVDPPFDRTVFLDVIPAGGAPPLRLLPSTRANYSALAGAGATSLENFRRLAAHIQARHPGVLMDDPSAAFLRDRKPPRQFAAISQFAEYDSRY